jgi:hypothetical protein
MPRPLPRPPTSASTTDGQPSKRVSFDPNSRTVAESCNAAHSRPGLPLIRRVRLAALMTAVEPQQPGYFSHSDAAAAPVDRFPQRKTLIAGHCPQRLPSALLSAPNESIAFTQRGQHRGRQSFEPAFPVGRSLRSTACASNAERRAACRTDC